MAISNSYVKLPEGTPILGVPLSKWQSWKIGRTPMGTFRNRGSRAGCHRRKNRRAATWPNLSPVSPGLFPTEFKKQTKSCRIICRGWFTTYHLYTWYRYLFTFSHWTFSTKLLDYGKPNGIPWAYSFYQQVVYFQNLPSNVYTNHFCGCLDFLFITASPRSAAEGVSG